MNRIRAWNQALVVGALILPAASLHAQQPESSESPVVDASAQNPVEDIATVPAEPVEPSAVASEAAAPEATAEAPAAEAVSTIAVDPGTEAEPAPKAAPSGRSRMVEEIIVTANRREENVQDIPQSVTAFSNEKLEALGIQTVQDLPNITPGLTITNQAGFNQVFLRGVGTDAFLPGADASVPFYVDGIPLLSTQGSSDALGKIQRVEVLKGPQGTLFGANSVGGAINIVTPDPSQTFEGDVQVGFGNYDSRKGAAFVNLPITESLAASVAVYGAMQDNFYRNESDSGEVINVYNYGGRVKVLWDITDNIDNTISASYNRGSNNAGLIFENTLPAPRVPLPGGGFISPIAADPKADRVVNYEGFRVGARLNSTLIADTLQVRLPWFDVKAIGSYQDLVPEDVRATFGAGPLALARQAGKNRQYTGELQFLSNAETPFNDRFTWVGGLFYIDTVGGLDPFSFIIAPGLVNGLGIGSSPLITGINSLLAPITSLAGYDPNQGIILYNRGVIESYSISGYFQGTLAITDELGLILGGRYQHTRKELTKSQTSYFNDQTGTETVLISDDLPVLNSNQFSSRVGLQYRFSNDTQGYGSWARGYKTPTYNTVNLLGSTLEPILPVKAQRNDAFELGLKTDLLDGALRVNSAVFYTKQKDLLTGTVQVLSGGIVNYDNAPAARILGAETEVVWSPMPESNPGLAVTFSGSYLDTKYTDYPNGRGYDPATGLSYGPKIRPTNPLPLLPERDQTGNQIPRTPKFTGNLGIGQSFALENGSVEFAVDGNYNSGFYWSAQNSSIEKTFSYELFNARMAYKYDPWRIEVEASVRNLTNEDYLQTIFIDDFGRNVILNDPRTYGLRMKWSF